jgi:4-hydroxyacetophenone monooxygenase
MDFDAAPQPITDDDATIRAAVAAGDVDVFPLLGAVAHLTGDLSLLRDELRPDQARLLEPEAGISDEQKAEGHELVAAALIRHRDAGCPPAPMPSDAQLGELIEFFTGPTTDDYRELLTEELALEGDPRAPAWHKAELAPDADFHVAIIGSGMSGIVAAHRLAQAGVAFTIFEKNDEVGGTWWENTYPGCRVDVPNHTYSYSFAQTGDWPQFFSTQQVLLDYFRTCAERLGLKEHTRFGTEVARATFDDDTQTWSLDLRAADGGEERAGPFHAVVSAVGQLNRPRWPDIPGRDRYEGQSFHSAQWDHSIDLTGKRVAVIGTGASAAQFIPAVAEEAAELVVFQRTPPWLIPTPNYQAELSEGLRWVIRHVPGYARWDRLWLFWRTLEGLHPMAAVDPEWPDQERSVSLLNDVIREMFTAYFQLEFTDPALLEKVLPTYPPLSKRFVRDNGIWARTLTRENVTLVTDGIAEITEKGVRTEDGTEHVVDVLVYGTGFQASRFLTPMAVTGVGGVDLHEQWDGEARAYLGLTVPDFPNLFLMYGPNTNIVVNGSIIYFSECEAHYIVESVRMLLEAGKRSMDPRHDVHDEYNRRVDDANRNMAWGASTVNSWYKNASGRITQNWPFPLLDYWLQTREPDPDDYVLR